MEPMVTILGYMRLAEVMTNWGLYEVVRGWDQMGVYMRPGEELTKVGLHEAGRGVDKSGLT